VHVNITDITAVTSI